MRVARLVTLAALVSVGSLASPTALADSGEDRLIKAIESDPAFKVRMQAVRVLTRRLQKGGRPSKRALNALGRALGGDDSHLVRGLAAFSLGSIGDGRARKALQAGMNDGHPFVRAQAKSALAKLKPDKAPTPRPTPTPTPTPSPGGVLPLVIEVQPMPGVDVPAELQGKLQAVLEADAKKRTGGRFRVGRSGTGKGFTFKGSIAQHSVERTGGKTRITFAIRLTVATYPDNNLRHVFSTKASASSSASSAKSIARLEAKVLEAAAKAATRDAVKEILK